MNIINYQTVYYFFDYTLVPSFNSSFSNVLPPSFKYFCNYFSKFPNGTYTVTVRIIPNNRLNVKIPKYNTNIPFVV